LQLGNAFLLALTLCSAFFGLERHCMFDVYLNDRRDLLVVRKGIPISVAGASGRWRKRKKVVSVSDDIRLAVQSRGYYMRKLKDLKNDRSRSGREERAIGRRHGL
jgi:hypothetical protein